MRFEGKTFSAKSSAAELKPILARMAELGYSPSDGITVDGLIKLFQDQHSVGGRHLKPDGLVGRATWDALFGPVPTRTPAKGLPALALLKAQSQIHVVEEPIGSNGGPEVDTFLQSVGLGTGHFWCMAFVHWCFQEAAEDAARANPFPKTGHCLDAWRKVSKATPQFIVTKQQALENPTRVRPGAVFILDHGGGAGHTGFVSRVDGTALKTIEGNSNRGGNRNGVGVFDLDHRRTTADALKGFIDFTEA